MILMTRLVQERKRLASFLVKQRQTFALNSYLFNGKEIYKFKTNDKDVNFPTRFCPGSILVLLNLEKYF